MGYAIHLEDPVTRETIHFESPHEMRGSTYAVGGTTEAWLSVTYNYSKHYYRVFGEDGIRKIYGKTGAEAIPIISEAIASLDDDVSDDYWEPTQGNAKRALNHLLAFAQMRPDGIFEGD
jgi:hypothetical protein